MTTSFLSRKRFPILLVGPLYGNNPGIGIRELIQNAVDAVREFNDLVSRQRNIVGHDRYDQRTDVALHIECDKAGLPVEVVITDRGVGMTSDVIRNYFLKAGASLRQSEAWRREHEDASGRSRVLRTGRFGVGALAAFLLGDEIEVTTRHALSPAEEGINFSARLDDETISLHRVNAPIGTRIKIRIPEHSRQRIGQILPGKWQSTIGFGAGLGHYFLQSPSLERTISSRSKPVQPSSWLP